MAWENSKNTSTYLLYRKFGQVLVKLGHPTLKLLKMARMSYHVGLEKFKKRELAKKIGFWLIK